MPDFLVFSALVPKLLGAKVILDVQDSSPELMAVKAKGWTRTIAVRLALWQERISVAFADHIITIGWTIEQVLQRRGVPKQKMTSIMNSADPKFFPPSLRCPPNAAAFTETRPFMLMYHGTLAERQGLDIAVRAVELASAVVPHIRLDIKGRGEHLPMLKALAEELRIAEKVWFTEMCPYDEVVDFVLHGDVGIIPYRKDGYMELVLPTKAFEFAWMQRPMIAADMPGMRSLFRANSVAFCAPSNPSSFAAAIVDLYANAERRIQMVQNAEEDYQAYRWEIMAVRYQLVLSMLSLKMARRPVKSCV
jgi:glycosyltransferase involved in cell wall biosynthesis